MKNLTFLFSFFIITAFLFVGCKPETPVITETPASKLTLPETPYAYTDYEFPAHFGTGSSFNPFGLNDSDLTDDGATLGRVLFYDTQLSLNNSISCGSCHFQSLAFSDGKKFSPGFQGGETTRNSLGIANASFARSFFWDTKFDALENQVLQPVKNHIEMGMESLDYLEEKLTYADYYPALFEKAFGSPEITSEKIGKALAQFVKSIVTYESKYDKGEANEFADFTALETMGKELFFSDRLSCAHCHVAPIFGGYYGANIGLDVNYADEGAGSGSFKVPTLRNIMLTAPYMHDGRYEDLDEVLDFYSNGIKPHPNLHWALQENGAPKQLNLTEIEKQAIIAFFKTLTDEQLINDPKFSNPFEN